MQRVSLRKAVEILRMQGIEVSWGENLDMEDFFCYYDRHYVPKLERPGAGSDVGKFFAMDILTIFE